MNAFAWTYLRHHATALGAWGRVLYRHLLARRPVGRAVPDTPTAIQRAQLAALPARLVAEFLRFAGRDDDSLNDDALPVGLVAQWALPEALRAMAALPYSVLGALHRSLHLQVFAPMPRGLPLTTRTRVLRVRERAGYAHVDVEVIIGTTEQPTSLIVTLAILLPANQGVLRRRLKAPLKRVASGMEAVRTHHLDRNAGRHFAVLTGDLNPIHWSHRFARRVGFDGPVLHGLALVALVLEALELARAAEQGRAGPWRMAVRFLAPVVLPSSISVFTDGAGRFCVGECAGGPAMVAGEIESRPRS